MKCVLKPMVIDAVEVNSGRGFEHYFALFDLEGELMFQADPTAFKKYFEVLPEREEQSKVEVDSKTEDTPTTC